MNLFFVLLSTLCLLEVSTQAQQLSVGQQRSISLKSANHVAHSISIKISDLNMNSHLSFQLQSLKFDYYGQIEMTIVTTYNQPIGSCSGARSVACLIPLASLSKQTMNAMISSNVDGEFKFIMRWVNYTLFSGQLEKIQMVNQIAQYYEIPIKDQLFYNMRIILVPHNSSAFGRLSAKNQLYLNKVYQSIDLWNGAQGLFLSKLELSGHKYLYLTVVGQRNFKYNLICQVIKKDHHDLQIPEEVYEAMTPFQRQNYHIKCDNLAQNQQIIVSFQIFSGNLQALFYLDRQMKRVIKTKYFHYMADSKFTFTKSELQNSNDIYFKILSSQQKLVFKLQVSKVQQREAELLLENAYNFQSVADTKYLYFYLKPDQHIGKTAINVSISLMNLLGSTKMIFFTGSSKFLSCLPKCQSENFKEIKDLKANLIALKSQFKISIPNIDLTMSSIILLKLQRKNQRKIIEQVTIQYEFEGIIRDLRENYPLTEVIQKSQLKYYRYTPYQSSKTVKLCVSVISGNVGLLGSFSNPVIQRGGSITGLGNCIQFPYNKIKKSIYASVYGIEKSKYSISIQIGQKQQVAMIPVLETNEDVDYEVTVAPQSSYVFVLHPIYPNLRVIYNSSRPMNICFLKAEQGQKGCLTNSTRSFEVAGQFYQKQTQKPKPRKIQVTNPSNSASLQFRMKYHSGDYDHCEQKLLNKVYEEDISSNSCFQFQLPSNLSNKSYQIMAKQLYYNPSNMTVGICGKDVFKFKNKRVVELKSSEIMKYCTNKQQNTIQLIVQTQAKLETTFKIQYILQSVSQLMRLATNIKFEDRSVISQTDPLRQYVVSTGVDSNTVIFMKQYSSPVLATVSVYLTNDVNYNTETYKKLSPIASQTMKKDLQMALVVLAVDIKKSCQQLNSINTSQCQVIVVVQPSQRKSIGEYLEYSIQFKSTNRQIKEYQPEESFLAEIGDSDVFSFYPNLEQPMSAKYMGLVKISSHNQKCANIYINRFDEPQKASSLSNSTALTHLFTIDRNAYLIEVESFTANCRYSIQVTIVQSKQQKSKAKQLSMLHPQIHYDLSLSSDEVAYFITDASVQAKTRLLYIRKLGDIRMYAVPLDETMESKILKNESYIFADSDFTIAEEFPNILNLPKKQNSLLLIAIEAQSHSQGTIILHNKNFPIVVPHSKKIVDNISPGEKSTLRFYAPSSKLQQGIVKMDLIYGKADLQASFIVDSHQKIIQVLPISASQCCSSSATNQIPFKFVGLKNPEYLQIVIKNDQNSKDIAIFEASIELQQNEADADDIDKEAMTTVQLIKQEKSLIKSKILSKTHKIIVSTLQKHDEPTLIPQQQLNQTNTTVIPKSNTLLQCVQASIPQSYKQFILISSKEIILDNVLIITVEWVKFIFKQSFDLLLEMSLSDECPVENLTVSIAPSLDQRISILSPFRWAYLKKQRNFAVASKNQFLIDIISCAGPVELSLAKSFSELFKDTQLQQGGSMIKNQPHVLKITPLQNQSISYFKLQSEEATIRYIDPDLQKQSGVGYLKYEWDYFLYDTDFQKLTLYLQPIKNISATKTKIFDAQYLVRIIGGIDPIKSSVQCVDVGKKTIYWRLFKGSKQNKQLVVLISKEELLNQMDGNPQQLYISVDLILSLQTPQGKLQTYKFLAPIQQIPVDIFSITRLSNKIIGFGILTIIAVIFGCIGLAECFIKYVVPYVGRIKWNNQLVEEDIAPHSDQHESVPAASDRNQRPSTQLQNEKETNVEVQLAVQTQQKMNQ